MKDEELAEEYYYKTYPVTLNIGEEERKKEVTDIFLAGLKAGRPQWHKVTDWKDNSQFPKDELKTYLVRLYQDHYVICELNITEGHRQFYLLDNLEYIDPDDVVEWCELPKSEVE